MRRTLVRGLTTVLATAVQVQPRTFLYILIYEQGWYRPRKFSYRRLPHQTLIGHDIAKRFPPILCQAHHHPWRLRKPMSNRDQGLDACLVCPKLYIYKVRQLTFSVECFLGSETLFVNTIGCDDICQQRAPKFRCR